MKNKRAVVVGAVLVFVAAVAGSWFYFQSKVIEVWVYTDYAFRFKHADWPGLVESRFKEVNRIYQRNGTGIRWKVVDSSQIDPTADLTGIDVRRASMALHFDRKTDVFVVVTGVREGDRTGSVNPFTRVAVVVDYPEKSESVNGRLMAWELTHLFGVPSDAARPEMLMQEKPESGKFPAPAIALIKRMRNYPFTLGIDALSQGSWEKRALGAVADYGQGAQGNATVRAHEVLGTTLLGERKTDAAVAQFRLAVQGDPKDTAARLNLGEAYARNGQEELAVEQAREAVRLAPDKPFLHRELGALLGRTHQPEAAAEEFRIAARMEPANSDTQVQLGQQLAGVPGHLDDAIAAMQEAVRLDPGSPRARGGLEQMQALKQRIAGELAKQRGLLQDRPNDPDVRYRLAQAEASAGDLKGAIRDLQKCNELRPGNGSVHAVLADLYVRTGDTNSAWAEVRKARELGAAPPPSLIARLGPEK